MSKTMKAAVVHEFGKPLSIEEVAVPKVQPGEIIVKVKSFRCLPYRSACRRRRLAGETRAALYPRP